MNLKGNVKSIKLFQYKAISKNGVIEKEKIENLEGVAYINNQFFFNKKGMIEEQREYISDKLKNKYLYFYDKDLNVTKKEYYNSLGELISKSNFENIHNSNGELIEEKEIMNGEQFKNNWTHRIFKNKNEITKNEYLDSNIYRSYEYQYDDKGNIIQEISYNNDRTIFFKIMTSFDDNNNRIKDIVLDDKEGKISQTHYKYPEFDTQNNWKRILIYKDDILTKLTEVKIEYFQ